MFGKRIQEFYQERINEEQNLLNIVQLKLNLINPWILMLKQKCGVRSDFENVVPVEQMCSFSSS